MGASEENSALFPIFVLTLMALPLVPYTIVNLFGAFKKKAAKINCQCSVCVRSGKYHKSIFRRISNFSTYSNLTLVLLWIVMAVLVYYIKQISTEVQIFEPFSILGLEYGASDSEIKKAYRRLSIQYHPDKNPDPEAHSYFVEFISKAYQALTDPISRENFEKYGHPDGRQGLQMGIALPQFLLNIDGASEGILLLGIVGVCIILPLTVSVIYLSRSSKYTGNYVMHSTLAAYYHLMKPSLAPSKVMDVFIKASEFMDIPVRRSDEEPLQRLFVLVRSELNLDLKNIRQEQAKFWKQHPALVKTELLLQTQLTRETAALSPTLQRDFRRVLELAPRLLEELMKMAIIPRPPVGHGWLRPAIGVVELSQSIVQAVPLSARKAAGASSEGYAPFLQLPHFSEAVVKKIARKVAITAFHLFLKLSNHICLLLNVGTEIVVNYLYWCFQCVISQKLAFVSLIGSLVVFGKFLPSYGFEFWFNSIVRGRKLSVEPPPPTTTHTHTHKKRKEISPLMSQGCTILVIPAQNEVLSRDDPKCVEIKKRIKQQTLSVRDVINLIFHYRGLLVVAAYLKFSLYSVLKMVLRFIQIFYLR